MSLDQRRIASLAAVLVTAAGLAIGCSGPSGSMPGSPALPIIGSPATASAAPSSTEASPSTSVLPSEGVATIKLTEADRGTVVMVSTGTTVSVVLHSTYWSPATSSDESVLAGAGGPTVSPDPPGSCLPGIGCGTVTSIFVAQAPGRVVLSASRTVCGEARSCGSADTSWEVVVEVRA
jgi:hypothetical protein